MIEVPIVDAHHHLTDLSRSYPWLERAIVPRYHGNDLPLRRDYLLDDYLLDFAALPLAGSVHIENGAADALAESCWIDRVIQRHGLPSAQVVKVDLTAPNVPELLEQHLLLPSVRGVRDILNWHRDPLYTHRDRGDLLTDPSWLAGFRQLGRHGLSFDLQVFPEQLLDAARLAANHLDTEIVLDHAGMPVQRDDQYLQMWRQGIAAVAAQPNTSIKVSGLGLNDHRWTVQSIRPIALDVIDTFGPQRTMFGSNFPVDSLYSSVTKLYNAFDDITSDLNPADRRSLFADTARDFYRLSASPPQAATKFSSGRLTVRTPRSNL